jgi:hypothetical protein
MMDLKFSSRINSIPWEPTGLDLDQVKYRAASGGKLRKVIQFKYEGIPGQGVG